MLCLTSIFSVLAVGERVKVERTGLSTVFQINLLHEKQKQYKINHELARSLLETTQSSIYLKLLSNPRPPGLGLSLRPT